AGSAASDGLCGLEAELLHSQEHWAGPWQRRGKGVVVNEQRISAVFFGRNRVKNGVGKGKYAERGENTGQKTG
ncbi:MAG: hypothetical protein ACKPJD_12245, partial [Planctomycetaceae bacterium]